MFVKQTIFLLLLIPASIISSRTIKRKRNYIHPPPVGLAHLPLPPSTPTPEPPPYHFEEAHLDDYSIEPEHFSHKHYETQESKYTPHDHYGQQTVLSGTYLIDNGLRSIAKGSADQANTAVASQNAAGKQAAYVAKSTLAQAATQAAGTAVAVLKGKEVLLKRLDEQTTEAHKAMQSELQQLQQAKRSAKAAQYAAQQALNHVSILTAALNNAQTASDLAQKAASESAAELASQIDMVAQAKTKLEQIETQLYTTRLDYEETKDAAEKATLSAQEAQLNANDAALHANVELQSETGSTSAGTTHVHLPETANDQEVHSVVKRRFKIVGNIKKP